MQRGCRWLPFLFLLLSKDHGSAEVGKMVKEGRHRLGLVQAWGCSIDTLIQKSREPCWLQEGQGSLEFSWPDQAFVFCSELLSTHWIGLPSSCAVITVVRTHLSPPPQCLSSLPPALSYLCSHQDSAFRILLSYHLLCLNQMSS